MNECWYAVQKLRDVWKFYKIVPQFPADEHGILTDTKSPEYFILFEGSAKPADERKDIWRVAYDGFEVEGHPSFIRVFKTLDEAKARAVLQYQVIANLMESYFPTKQKD